MREWLKLPGLFHRFELEQVIDADGHHEYLFEAARHDADGRELIAVYCRSHDNRSGTTVGPQSEVANSTMEAPAAALAAGGAP